MTEEIRGLSRIAQDSPRGLLIVGILSRGAGKPSGVMEQAEALLAAEFGPIAERSPVIPFDFTDYYRNEMGDNLLRCWLAFSSPVAADRLAEIKLATIRIEQQLLVTPSNPQSKTHNPKSPTARSVNLDPGLLTLHNLVLATTKNFAHRVYIGSGIYAELTLIFHSGRFEPLPWTYPDYQTDVCRDFLMACRAHLRKCESGD